MRRFEPPRWEIPAKESSMGPKLEAAWFAQKNGERTGIY
jgi:hypothetical protein